MNNGPAERSVSRTSPSMMPDHSHGRLPLGRSRTRANGLWLGADVDGLVDWFLDHQLADGEWKRRWSRSAHDDPLTAPGIRTIASTVTSGSMSTLRSANPRNG